MESGVVKASGFNSVWDFWTWVFKGRVLVSPLNSDFHSLPSADENLTGASDSRTGPQSAVGWSRTMLKWRSFKAHLNLSSSTSVPFCIWPNLRVIQTWLSGEKYLNHVNIYNNPVQCEDMGLYRPPSLTFVSSYLAAKLYSRCFYVSTSCQQMWQHLSAGSCSCLTAARASAGSWCWC